MDSRPTSETTPDTTSGSAHPARCALACHPLTLDRVEGWHRCTEAKTHALVVTITNGSTENFDPSSVLPTMLSGGLVASYVYDDKNGGLGGTPNTTLLSGRTVSFKVGFGVADPKDIVIEVPIGFECAKPIWATPDPTPPDCPR